MSVGGRGVWNRKNRVDEVRSIDILDLQRKGVFSRMPAFSGTLSWSRNDEVTASIFFRVESTGNGPVGLRLVYTIKDKRTGEGRDHSYIVPMTSTSCNFGGVRWWFICPLVVNGRVCHRRCRIIYMPPDAEFFGCRECYKLTYESRQRHREKFYEGFEKPHKAWESAQKELAKVRSRKKKEKIWRKMSNAYAAVENFENSFKMQTSKIIYKEK